MCPSPDGFSFSAVTNVVLTRELAPYADSTSYEDIWRRTAALSLLHGRRPSSAVHAVEQPQLSQISDRREQREQQQPEAEHGFLLRRIAGDGRCEQLLNSDASITPAQQGVSCSAGNQAHVCNA